MLYYLNLFLLLFLLAKNNYNLKSFKIWMFISLSFLFLLLGSRYYIGGDYFGYMNLYNKMDYINRISYPFYQVEVLYYSIIMIFNRLGLSYYLVNFFLMFITIFFFQKYIKNFQNPFFVLLISLPILFIPISINFVRQAIAISIFLFSIKFLVTKDFKRYFFYIVLAALFHKFAIVYSIFYFAYETNFKKKIKFIILALFFLSLSLFVIFNLEQFNSQIVNAWANKITGALRIYTDDNYPIMPKGSVIRLGIISLSFFILIYFQSFFKKDVEYKVWFYTGLITLFLIPISIFYPFLVSRIIIFFYTYYHICFWKNYSFK